MCLAIPGKVESIRGDDPLTRMGKVNFGGILKDACLAYVPEARVGDYVIVHVGFALSRLDETEAHKVLEHLTRIGELADLEVDGSGAIPGWLGDNSGPACPPTFPVDPKQREVSR